MLFWQQWSNSDWKTLVDYNTNECIIKTILKDTFFGYINEKNRKVWEKSHGKIVVGMRRVEQSQHTVWPTKSRNGCTKEQKKSQSLLLYQFVEEQWVPLFPPLDQWILCLSRACSHIQKPKITSRAKRAKNYSKNSIYFEMHARLFDALLKELCDPLIRKENIFQVRSKEFAPHQRGSCQVDIGSSCCPRTQTKFVVKSLSQLLVAVIHNPKDNPELLPISR